MDAPKRLEFGTVDAVPNPGNNKTRE